VSLRDKGDAFGDSELLAPRYGWQMANVLALHLRA